MTRGSTRALLAGCALSAAFSVSAFDPSRWIEVDGGPWHPTPIQLSALETALQPAVAVGSKNRGRIPNWNEYTIQYQGRFSLLAKQYILVNGFCDHEAM